MLFRSAGVAGSVAGLASLVSYPALLAVGLPALTANVTNTVALVLYSVGAVTTAVLHARRVFTVPAAAPIGCTRSAVSCGNRDAGFMLMAVFRSD